jgi:two-component system cell cycle sensor histidine kinase/response regulator CckA
LTGIAEEESDLPQMHSVGRDTMASHFRRIERREWWLWTTAIIVTLLLMLGLSSLILPALRRGEDTFSLFMLPQAVRSLLGLVLVFDVYTIYQQLQIHRMRRRLLEREELFRLISENAADMIAVVDMEGRRIYNSLAYQRVLGYSPEELKEISALEQIHPDDREYVRAAAEEARRTGVSRNLEYRFRHKDGSWRVLESTSSVIPNSKGAPEKLVIVNRDISERKRASEALRLSEASFRSVIENAPYGIYRADATGQLLRANPAIQKMLGYASIDELLQVNLATHVYGNPQEYQRVNALLENARGFKDVEVEWKRKDGSPFKVRCSGQLMRNEGEREACFEVFVEDVTEKRVLESQLRMAQKMEAIGRLSGGIAHDFNNLLGVIIGYSEVLKKKLGTVNPLFEHAEEIEKAGKRAASLTRQLLAFSRQQVLEPAILNLNELVLEMGKMITRLIGEDIELATRLNPALGRVKADQSQMEQVLLNLAVNARDAMPQGGKLLIETSNVTFDEIYTRQHPGSKAGHYVMLSVTDTGTGMDAETLAHLFEPFFTTKERGKGTGLGLATVYGVVKQSGGYIWVDSELIKGSTFKIHLPLLEEKADVQVSMTPTKNLARGSETVLFVEDAEALRKLGQALLEENGYRVFAAEDGAEALQIVAEKRAAINILVTDVIMPGINGRVLADRLRPLQPGIKVLYMSGYTDSAIAEHGVLEPGTYLLHKPFTEEALLQKVREVLDGIKAGQPVSLRVPKRAGCETTNQR